MASPKTITINGRHYDAVTGLPTDVAPAAKSTSSPKTVAPKPSASPEPAKQKVARPAGTPRPDVVRITTKPGTHASSSAVHGTVQRSQALKSRVAKKPAAPQRPVTKRPVVGRQMDVATSAGVTHFAKHPASVQPKAASAKKINDTKDAPVQMHPVSERAVARTSVKAAQPAKTATSKEVKDAAITKALATPSKKPAKRTKQQKRNFRRLLIIIGAVLLVVVALFAVYRLVPSISVGIASAQAGVDASYPEFTPDGYSLSQPVTYSDGQVDLKFHSNSNDNYYVISQSRSSWDSSAVLDNVVTPAAGADYVTTKERGLTIYTFDSIAVWVNGGILYKIDSKAPLSGDQIRHIATSL